MEKNKVSERLIAALEMALYEVEKCCRGDGLEAEVAKSHRHQILLALKEAGINEKNSDLGHGAS